MLPFIFDGVTATIPAFLQGIFDPNLIFDATTDAGAAQIAKYVVGGVVTWGYLLPFFLSNLIANIYGYIQNKKTTFKSDAPKIMFVIYIVLMIVRNIINSVFSGEIFQGLDRLLGFAFGVIEGLALVALLLIILKAQPWFDVQELLDQSFFYKILGWVGSLPTTVQEVPVPEERVVGDAA